MIQVYPVLRQRMRDSGISYRELAAVIDVNVITLWLKMCGIKQWCLPEVVKICCFFRTSDAERMFLRNNDN